jgi:hypothetical protein
MSRVQGIRYQCTMYDVQCHMFYVRSKNLVELNSPHQGINESSNHQIIKSSNHQITKSSNHQIIKSPNHQINESLPTSEKPQIR